MLPSNKAMYRTIVFIKLINNRQQLVINYMYFEAKKSMRTEKMGTKPNEKHFQHVSNETIIIAWANNRMYVYIIIHFVKCVGEPHDFKPLSTCLMLFFWLLKN